jgi:hypothetical protein
MSLKTITRLSTVLAILFSVIGGVVAFVAPGAGALEQDGVVLDKKGETVVDYLPLIGNNPGANVDASTTIGPETCQAAGCDMIPLEIKEPAGATDGEFFVHITLEWDTQEAHNVPVFGDYTLNDLDLWLQNDPLVEDAGPGEDGFTYYSAGSGAPEEVTMYKPVGKWNIFVVNASGANTGYRLKFDVIVDDIPSNIFESLPPQFRPQAPAPIPTTTIPPTDFSVEPPPTVTIAPATPPVADTSFDTAANEPTLEDQLAAAPDVQTFKPVAASKPAPPSTLAIFLWMLALPLALIALFGFVLLRRQRGMLAAEV